MTESDIRREITSTCSTILNDGGKMQIADYTTKLIGITSDGASVNTGCRNGLMVQLEREGRDWLIKLHCTNHRIELAMKDLIKETDYTDIDNFYITNFYILRNSGKIKSEIREAAKVLNIQHYTLSKLTGTHFVGHRRTAFQLLLDMWPAITLAYENVVADNKTVAKTRAKVTRQLRKFKSYDMLCKTSTYLDILELITPVFEGEGLLPCDIRSIVDETIIKIEDAIDDSGTDEEMITSHLARFMAWNEEGEVEETFIKADDKKRDNRDREFVAITFPELTHVSEDMRARASNLKKDALTSLKGLLAEKVSDFSGAVFKSIKWFNPQNWTADRNYGVDEIEQLIAHFQAPLQAAKFDKNMIYKEWKLFKNYVAANASIEKNVWVNVFRYKQKEYHNICILAEIVLSLSGSNSTVERAFSLLTLLLTDRRLSMSHNTMEDMIIININDKLWSSAEREDILRTAAE